MLCMLAAARAILIQSHTTRVIPAILLAGIIAFLAIVTSERDDWANILLLRGHTVDLRSNSLTGSPLVKNLSDHAGANRQTTFTNCKF